MTLSEQWAPVITSDARIVGDAQSVYPLRPADQTQLPQWWLNRLFRRLVNRAPAVRRFDDYYTGDHPLPWLPEQARQEFRRILWMTRTNYMGLVVDAMVERTNATGIKIDGTYSDDLWAIWRANNLDVDGDQAILEAAKSGTGYLLVGPNRANRSQPIVSVEHPLQAVVENVPGNRRARAAGLKVYLDDWTGSLKAELQIAGAGLFRFTGKQASAAPSWKRDADDPEPLPAGEVSLIEMPNNPKLLLGGISEIADVTDVQDRINKTVADRLMTQDFGAFPQKWATGYPDDEEIEIGRSRMVTTDVKETVFGQWQAAPLDPYSIAKKEDVKDIASRTRTPAQYLLSGDFSNVNGETLTASESGLVAKVSQRTRPYGQAIEDAMRIAARLAGLDISSTAVLQTQWQSPQFHTEAEMSDAATKALANGVPYEVVWERYYGASSDEVKDWRTKLDQRATDPMLAQILKDAGASADTNAGP